MSTVTHKCTTHTHTHLYLCTHTQRICPFKKGLWFTTYVSLSLSLSSSSSSHCTCPLSVCNIYLTFDLHTPTRWVLFKVQASFSVYGKVFSFHLEHLDVFWWQKCWHVTKLNRASIEAVQAERPPSLSFLSPIPGLFCFFSGLCFALPKGQQHKTHPHMAASICCPIAPVCMEP